jgi:hypothetical protein
MLQGYPSGSATPKMTGGNRQGSGCNLPVEPSATFVLSTSKEYRAHYAKAALIQ